MCLCFVVFVVVVVARREGRVMIVFVDILLVIVGGVGVIVFVVGVIMSKNERILKVF